MPRHDEFGILADLLPSETPAVAKRVPGGGIIASGTDWSTGSGPEGSPSGAVSSDYTRKLERKRDQNIIRDFGMEGLVDYYEKRVARDTVERQARELETFTREQREAGLKKTAAESMKLTGEALKAMAEAQAGPGTKRALTFWDVSQGLASERHQKAGKPGVPTFEDINIAAGDVRFEGARGAAQGAGAVPAMISQEQITETQERAVRINQTKQVLDPQIWDTAMRSWGAPGRLSGTLGSALELGGYLSPELQMLYNVIDKMGIKERHDFFGANFTPGEAAVARTIIPNRKMHPAKLKSVLELNRMIDEWAEAFEVEMSQASRNSAKWLTKAQIFRKHYPFPVTAEQATVYSPSAQEKQGMMSPPATRKIGETWTFPDGKVGRWDGRAWEVIK